jgi:type IV secretory pathway VirB10-like protein
MTTVEVEVKPEVCDAADSKTCDNEPISPSHKNATTLQPDPPDTNEPIPSSHNEPSAPQPDPSDTNEAILSSHNEPTAPQPPPADTVPEIKNVLEDESKAGEEQAAEPADSGIPDSPQNMFFLDPDHYYDGNESGTEEDQAAFMKELENFFRERSMDFKPPKFYGEGLNCLK